MGMIFPAVIIIGAWMWGIMCWLLLQNMRSDKFMVVFIPPMTGIGIILFMFGRIAFGL